MHRRVVNWHLERRALYVRYRQLSLVTHPHRNAVSIGVVVGPFRGATGLERAEAIFAWYEQVTDNPDAYWRACRSADISVSHDTGASAEEWAPDRCHLLTPDEALSIACDLGRIRELFATEPAAAVVAQRAPETLWDLLDDDDSATDEEEDE